MTTKIDSSLYIKISKFALNHPAGFSYTELKEGVGVIDDSWEDKIIKSYIDNALKSGETNDLLGPYNGHSYNIQTIVTPALDSIFFVIEKRDNLNGSRFILKYDAYFNYVDYLEYREALEASKSAKRYAIWSIGISVVLALVSIGLAIASILIQIYGSTTLDNNQFHQIIKQIEIVNNHK